MITAAGEKEKRPSRPGKSRDAREKKRLAMRMTLCLAAAPGQGSSVRSKKSEILYSPSQPHRGDQVQLTQQRRRPSPSQGGRSGERGAVYSLRWWWDQ